MDQPTHAVHGGAFFDAIGVDFQSLQRKDEVINADVLDAWYDPSPRVISALREHLPWLVRTSPPTHGEGLVKVISEVRGIPEDHIIVGNGTSSLMYLALPHIVRKGSKVTLLDPMYGEYEHIFRQVLHCDINFVELHANENFRLNVNHLIAAGRDSDLIALVNPNSPTGVGVDRQFVADLLQALPRSTKVWIDETYVDYAPGTTAEPLVDDPRLIIAKSMSKFYGLSGLRVGYLAGSPQVLGAMQTEAPPWSVGLLGQVGAVEALRDTAYYDARSAETHAYREQFVAALAQIPGMRPIPSTTNFVMVELDQPIAADLTQRCAAQDVFIRNCDSLSPRFQGHFIRLAVKPPSQQERILATLRG